MQSPGEPGMTPKVGVVLLNWHGWRDTINCLESLQSLDYPAFEIVVVDNASTDDSVQQIKRAFPHVQLLQNERNKGFGGGCNPGIRWVMERGAEMVWLLNNDTKVEPNTLTALVHCLLEQPRRVAAGSVLYYMDEPHRVQAWGGGRINFWLGTSKHFHHKPRPEELDYLTAASLLVKANSLKTAGLFDEQRFFMYWEDVDLCFRLRKQGGELAIAEDSRVFHKESASLGKENPLLAYYFNQSARSFFSKHSQYNPAPLAIGSAGRLFKRIIKRDWRGAKFLVLGIIKNPKP